MTNLVHLDLRNNVLQGRFPSTLPQSLVDLRLSDNQMIGEIPDVFNTLTHLEVLLAGNNEFDGEIHSSIGLLPKLSKSCSLGAGVSLSRLYLTLSFSLLCFL